MNPEGILSTSPGLEQPWDQRICDLQPRRGCVQKTSTLFPKHRLGKMALRAINIEHRLILEFRFLILDPPSLR